MLRHTTARMITASIDSGIILRHRRGVYGLPELPPASAAAMKLCAVLSHVSAAEHWKFNAIRRPSTAHVTIGPKSRAKAAKGVTVHRRSLGDGDYYSPVTGLLVTTPLRTVIDCAAMLSFREALAIADSALRKGKISRHELPAAAAAYRGPGAANVRRVGEHATGSAANPMESALRSLCIENRLGNFVPQVWIRHSPTTYCLDLADEGRLLDLEADGFEHHGHRKALHYDCTRNCELTRRGWMVLRFSWEHIMLEPEWVAEVIRDTLRHRRVRPGRRKA